MRLRSRMVAAGMALGLMASLSLAVPAPVGAATTVTLSCSGADADSQAILDLLGGLAVPPEAPPVKLSVSADVTADAPANLATGETGPVSFDAKMVLPQSLIDVQSLALAVKATGGGTGGPYNAAPANFTIGLSPVNVPTLTGSGNVTITDDTEVTLFEVVSPVSFTVAIDLGGTPLNINLTCAVPAGTYVGSINGSVPPPPTTITTTTTALQAASTTPRFTG